MSLSAPPGRTDACYILAWCVEYSQSVSLHKCKNPVQGDLGQSQAEVSERLQICSKVEDLCLTLSKCCKI